MTTLPEKCPCQSDYDYIDCCGRYIEKRENSDDPEQLMRSRFTAYALRNYQYIIDTYSSDKRGGLNVEQLKHDQLDTQWKGLKIYPTTTKDTVEFRAYYIHQNNWYVMHEKSNFVIQDGQWRYSDGVIFDDSGRFTPSRNDICPCGSGKKFKKCCLQ